MNITSLHSRSDLAKYLNKNIPQLACDYFIKIHDPRVTEFEAVALVTSFSFPDSGISYSNMSDIGHVVPAVNFGSSMSIDFVAPSWGISDIEDLFASQFVDGVPLFIPTSQLPSIYIYRIQTPVVRLSTSSVESYRSDLDSVIEAIMEADESKSSTEDKELRYELAMTLSGCRFTHPIPTINLSSDSACTYHTTVTFEDFEY